MLAPDEQTLILTSEVEPGKKFFEVGRLSRVETDQLIMNYTFDLKTNELIPKMVPNPGAGREHLFRAWRLQGSVKDPVSMRPLAKESAVPDNDDDSDNE